jgi:hypothetical protein
MGLLDQVNYTGGNKPIITQTPEVPEDIDSASYNQFKVDVPEQTQATLYKQIKETPKIAQEGIEGGNAAADALFNNNTTAFSRAIASKASRLMASNRASRTVSTELDNQKRQMLQQAQNMNDLNDVYKIKRQNFAGQLEFSAKMSNYYNQLSAFKLQALGSIIGGGFAVAGKVAAG